MRSLTLRRKLILATVALSALVAGGVGAGASWVAGRRAEERVRAEISRTAAVVVSGGFLWQKEALRQVARFLGAEVVTLRPGGEVAVTTAAPGRDAVLHAALRGLDAGPEGAPFVHEVRIEDGAATVALVVVPPFDDRLALVYPRHVLSEARAEALVPGLVAGGLGVLVAALAGALLARGVVRPIERLSQVARRIEAGDREARLDMVRTGDELEALAGALERMVAGLRAAEARAHEAERLAALGRIMAGLAHEIKNPLAAVRMTVELLLERSRGAEEKEALSLVLEEVERLTLFSAKLLTYAKEPVVTPRPAPLAPIVRDTARLLGRQLAHGGARLALDLDGDAPDALVDEVAFRHVVLNLLLNAMEAMPEGGAVRVSVASEEGWAALAVEDDGPGVAPDDAARLFTAFFSRKPGGTGLGLSMCRTLVQAHGGTIRFEPRRPRGARFVVRVPAAPVPAPLRTEEVPCRAS